MQHTGEALAMRWLKKHRWNASIVSVGMLFLLSCLTLIPLSAASAHEGTSGVATPTTATIQAAPTEDATVTALNKEQLTQQVAGQRHTWDNWFWSNAATVLSSFLSTLVLVIGALFGIWQWRVGRKDTQSKELEDRKAAQDKELEDRKAEREKSAEERFQAAVSGLGDQKEGARIGAAILLRTFLRPGYEQFYTQVFDLAVANLRLPRSTSSPEGPNGAQPLSTLSQSLIVVFKEAFPLVCSQKQGHAQSLDASDIQLDNAYLREANLKQVWMPQAFLRRADLNGANLGEANLEGAVLTKADLSKADLSGANLRFADLREAGLYEANLTQTDFRRANLGRANLVGAKFHRTNLNASDLSGADLSGADLSAADLSWIDLSGANLRQADLSLAEISNVNFRGANLSNVNFRGANLSLANLEDALSLEDTDLRGVKGLTKEQKVSCKAKSAIIDEDSMISSSQSTVTSSVPVQSNAAQASSAPSAQENTPSPNLEGSNTASSQPAPESGS